MLLVISLCICWVLQGFYCHDPNRVREQPLPSDTVVGVLTFPDAVGDASSHLISANSVDIPAGLGGKPHRKARQAETSPETDSGSNSLFGGDAAPKLTNIQADCINPQFIKVNVQFDKPFQGIIYTKGHFNDDTCLFTKDDNPGVNYNFSIPTDQCGSLDNHAETNASITESTIIIQNDPLFQDAGDVARRIRCAWSDRFDKIISSRGFKVGSLAENTMDYSADAVSVWMDLRMGKDPFQGTPVTNGVVRLGSDMTIVVYIKSKIDAGLDVVVRDCVANDAKKHQQIQLTDENGCVVQKKLMTPFTITDRVGQSGASRIAYAMLKSFKFPDSLDVNIICNVAMCKGDCGISCTNDKVGRPTGKIVAPVAKVDSSVKRTKRQANDSGSAQPAGSHGHAASVMDVDANEIPKEEAQPGNVVPVDTHLASGVTIPPSQAGAGAMDDTLIGKTVFLKEREPTEVILERGIRVLSDNDITEVLVGNQNRSYDILATTVKNQDYICLTRTGFGIGLGILLLIILILAILCVFFCCAACARRKDKTKVLENSSINIYNSTDQLNRSRGTTLPASNMSEPVSVFRGSLPNLNSYSSHSGDSQHAFVHDVPEDRQMRGSAMTLPGLGIHTNPMVRHSTQSLNVNHNLVPEKPFMPIVLPQTLEAEDVDDTEKMRSLRSVAVRERHRTVDISLDGPEADTGENTRSLRSFTLRSQHGAAQTEEAGIEAPRSLRSFSARSNQSQAPTLVGTERGNGEALRSLRSFTVRSHHSDSSNDTGTTVDNGENPRSEGTLRSGSQASLVQDNSERDENPRSLRSVSVYRN